MLTATFSSPYRADIDLRHQQQFTLPANRSISQSGAPIPQELSQAGGKVGRKIMAQYPSNCAV